MRRHATGWVVKVLFGILIVSFAVWGIGDVIRAPGGGADAVATVGDREISEPEVMREFDARYQALQRRAGQGLTRAQAASLGLVNQALDTLVARHLIDAYARDLSLSVSDAEVAEAIRGEPLFRGAGGGFDRARFEQYLRALGTNEAGYAASLRDDLVRARIVDGVTAPVAVPGALAERLLAYRSEQRRGRALIVEADEIRVDDPDEAALKAHLEANADRYKAPEYRGLTLVVVGPDDLAREVEIAEAELRSEYEARIAEYRTPETRGIEQLVAADEATAREAAGMAAAGQGFEAVAAALKGKGVERTQLGPLRRGDLPEALDGAVFAAAGKGLLAEPVQSPFGWHVVRVTEVRPETVRPFAEVRDELERELRQREANERLPAFATRLDDEVAGGATLEEAASRLGVTALKVDAVDRQGQNPKQEAVAADRLAPEILDAVFRARQGEPSLLNQTADGLYYMFRVDSVQPARPRTLEEVREVLADSWRKERQAERARARAEELRARITDAASFASVAATEGAAGAAPAAAEAEGGGDGALTVREVGPIRRDDQGYLAALTPEAVRAMFETPAGSVVPRVVPALEGSAVLLVDEVAKPDPQPAEVEQARAALADDMRSDVLQQLEAALQRRYAVRVDNARLARLMESQVDSGQAQ